MQAEKITGRQRKGGNKRARTKRERKGRRKTEDGAETGRKICLCVAGPGERKDGQRKRGCSLAPELDPAELVPTPCGNPVYGTGAPKRPLQEAVSRTLGKGALAGICGH